MNYQEFENKVKSMSAHDIIMSMVDGLRYPRTEIDMYTFGYEEDGICYGCAATNAILHIMDANKEEVEDHIDGRRAAGYKASTTKQFEYAIDQLRKGSVSGYNRWAKDCGIAQITPIPGHVLPCLYNDYTEKQLQEYEKLAKYQLTV